MMQVREPYDWDGILTWLGARAIPGVEQIEDGAYVRGNVRVVFRDGAVHTNREQARVRRLFDIDADPAAIHAVLSRDRMLAPLLRKKPGVRVPGAWDPFELALRAIVGQQVSVAAARTILGRIAATHGFDPARLAEVTLEGMPKRRAETVRLVARAFVNGVIPRLGAESPADGQRRALSGGDPALARGMTQLHGIPGIGPWTLNYIAMRSGDPDAFPAGDLVLRRAAGNLTERELLKRAEPWRPFRAYAAMLLWTR